MQALVKQASGLASAFNRTNLNWASCVQTQQRYLSAKFLVNRDNADECFSRLNRALREDGTMEKSRMKAFYEKPAAKKYRMEKSQKKLRQKRLIKKLVREAILQKEEGL
mmetsp:Transcript_5586/g.6398  ORF Transcript_5586/g.6398 Transcript_5586/m.6398 type:complete len:109 (-) Transcript_5586:154-480(-)